MSQIFIESSAEPDASWKLGEARREGKSGQLISKEDGGYSRRTRWDSSRGP